ncbi:hypothetical protein ASF70_12710 [Rhizobium sp. Leaf321]|uniref:hypothetical protein n=1 Tax=Rhizobium sp. Leaf321 TaxID=1736335 RepID=UPI000713F6A1|nr:hypothetical protein [Rhizobium sp. Leaf321]KQQ72389.1 hypothetical protein ASF70_12710 [Rhizobium sp. Leaf321]
MQFADEEFESIMGVIDNGGFYEIEIDASEIPMTAREEAWENIAPNLTTGFEMKPTSMIGELSAANDILTKIDTWGQIVVLIYRRGGKITYKKLPNGRYDARVERPKAAQ